MSKNTDYPDVASSQPSNVAATIDPRVTTAPAGAFKIRTNTAGGQDSHRNLKPGFYYHTSSREPVAAVKNIGNDSP
jgi:hypothetical protein